ncbi:Clp protease N-terminal domain-containing protein [Micromonospora chersina]|uniref:Clp protease N-terminal domain-containing protein n=1 Tax=Micromonospora chersina TaxID=47854 RepID=UPI0033CCDA6F
MSVHSERPVTTAGAAMLWTLAMAYRRCWMNGQAVVCTDHVLSELGRRLPSLKEQLAPLASLIADRVGHGWLGDDEPPATAPTAMEADLEASAILREAGWRAREPRLRSGPAVPPTWSAAVWEVTRSAIDDAQSVGVAHAHAMHLLPGILADPGYRSRRLLDAVGLDAERVMASMPVGVSVRASGEPIDGAVKGLRLLGVLDSTLPAPVRMVGSLLRAARPRSEGPVLFVVAQEAVREAVRLGVTEVGPEHLLLGITSVQDQLRDVGERFRPELVPTNNAAALLARWGIDSPSLLLRLARTAASDGPGLRARVDDPPWSASVTNAVNRAKRYGTDTRSRWPGTSHLLLALLTAEAGATRRLLRSMDVDVDKLGEEAARDLGHRDPTVGS